MTETPPFSMLTPARLVDLGVQLASTPPGLDVVELGVYQGGSAWHLAKACRRRGDRLHLFDTFAGIPEYGPQDDHYRPGHFADTSLAAVQAAIPDAIYHVGVFPSTVDAELRISFAHIDCDQYATCCRALEILWPMVVSGGAMLFDDYVDTSGVRLALDEWRLLEDRADAGIFITGNGTLVARKWR
jgi:O-methyltransferase